ncbi:hypothetical protein GGR57DRAFT_502007 [Xylariaceae sp. FL1272]|nr:hypothetical protein GGR57DRAFT_502007 [Xylariaceae sp. FL1272]
MASGEGQNTAHTSGGGDTPGVRSLSGSCQPKRKKFGLDESDFKDAVPDASTCTKCFIGASLASRPYHGKPVVVRCVTITDQSEKCDACNRSEDCAPVPALIQFEASRDLFLVADGVDAYNLPFLYDWRNKSAYDQSVCHAPREIRVGIARAQHDLLNGFIALMDAHEDEYHPSNFNYIDAVMDRKKLVACQIPKLSLDAKAKEIRAYRRASLLRLGPDDAGYGAWAVAMRRFIKDAHAVGRELWPQVTDRRSGLLVDDDEFVSWNSELADDILPIF